MKKKAMGKKAKIGKVGKGKRQRASNPQRGKKGLSKKGKEMMAQFGLKSKKETPNQHKISLL